MKNFIFILTSLFFLVGCSGSIEFDKVPFTKAENIAFLGSVILMIIGSLIKIPKRSKKSGYWVNISLVCIFGGLIIALSVAFSHISR